MNVRAPIVFFVAGLVLAGTALLNLGCRAAPAFPDPPSSAAESAEPNEIVLTLWHSETDARRATLETIAREFHEIYPNLIVNPVYVGNRDDLSKQLTAAIALGTPPDLVLAERRQLAELAQQGGLLALEEFISDPDLGLNDDDLTDLLPGMLEQGKLPEFGNRIYGFPFDLEAMILFYHPTLLQAANRMRPPRTWEEFADYASGLTGKNQYGWAMRADADTFEAMLVSRGSALLTNAENRALFNERAGVASMTLIRELSKAGAAKLLPSDQQARQEFARGRAAMFIGWMSELALIETESARSNTQFEIGIAPLPQSDLTNPFLLTRGDLFGILLMPRERARQAWFFVRWMTTPTQNARWVRGVDALPIRFSTLTELAADLRTNARFQQVAGAFGRQVPHFVPQPATRHIQSVERIVQQVWTVATQMNVEVPVQLDDLAVRVNRILANTKP